MSPSESSNPTEKYNTAEAQDKDLKVAIRTMFRDTKEGTDEFINEVYKNTNGGMK